MSPTLHTFRRRLAEWLYSYQHLDAEEQAPVLGDLADLWYELSPGERRVADSYTDDIEAGKITATDFFQQVFRDDYSVAIDPIGPALEDAYRAYGVVVLQVGSSMPLSIFGNLKVAASEGYLASGAFGFRRPRIVSPHESLSLHQDVFVVASSEYEPAIRVEIDSVPSVTPSLLAWTH